MANRWPMRLKFLLVPATLLSLLLLVSGCTTIADFFRQRPQALPPASELYAEGESQLNKSRYDEARTAFRKVAERHPQSTYAPRARFLIGEAFYREGQFDKAIKEFEGFMAFYPRHQIADLVQYRLSMSYYDQMKPVEQDQEITRKAMEAVQGARPRVPGEPLRGRRARQDRHLPGPPGPEGAVGRRLLHQPGQSRGGPPAAGEGGQGISRAPS